MARINDLNPFPHVHAKRTHHAVQLTGTAHQLPTPAPAADRRKDAKRVGAQRRAQLREQLRGLAGNRQAGST